METMMGFWIDQEDKERVENEAKKFGVKASFDSLSSNTLLASTLSEGRGRQKQREP